MAASPSATLVRAAASSQGMRRPLLCCCARAAALPAAAAAPAGTCAPHHQQPAAASLPLPLLLLPYPLRRRRARVVAGTVGGTNATPMLNPPEAAIVALGRVQALPRYDAAGQLVKRHVMAVSWGGDHRVIDGAGIAEFSNFWKGLLEEPGQLLMHMR